MFKFLIIYSTTDGHTLEICQRLKDIIEQKDFHIVTLIPVHESHTLNLLEFDKIVVGASIRYGKHNKHIYNFIQKNKDILDRKPNAFFSVNVVARKENKNQPSTNPYLIKFLNQISWKPNELAVFAGKIDYPKYNFFDKHMIRFIMWLTKGPTNPETIIEYTNWQYVEKFAHQLSQL